MADEPLIVRGINWRQTFPFINLFRAFRVAVHPSKLVLALVALILLYVSGQVLDLFWATDSRALPQEVSLYEQFSAHPRPGQTFGDLRQSERAAIQQAYALQLQEYKIEGSPESALSAAQRADDLGVLKIKIRQKRDARFADLTKDWKEARAAADKKTGTDEIDREYHNQARQIYARASTEYLAASKIKNLGLFDVYFDYEANQVSNVVHGVRTWNWFGQEPAAPQMFAAFNTMDEATGNLSDASVSTGVIQSVVRFFTVGPMWLLTQHPLYFVLFGTIFLVLWSIFGGAICRIAAVHVARDEKLSIRSALMFSGGKFLSFLFAPIIPLIIVVAIGLLVTAGSSLANIPYIGPIIVGALFILALAAGFLMALVLLGLIGGFNLMYPTVAVEGSDSFDAISRSFSYLYARPWRLGFYTMVSIVYGAVAFLFVRMFIWLMLVLTHTFTGMAIFTSAHSTAPLWNSLWPNPATSARLSYDIDSINLDASQWIAARLIWLWVHLIIAILGAFVVSFYFSANTIIYYLLRREVDATDMDDVYLEQVDDEFADPMISDPPPAAAGPTVAVASGSAVETDIAPPT